MMRRTLGPWEVGRARAVQYVNGGRGGICWMLGCCVIIEVAMAVVGGRPDISWLGSPGVEWNYDVQLETRWGRTTGLVWDKD